MQKRHQQCCLPYNMLLINSDETGNNRGFDIFGLLMSTFVSKTVVLISFSGKSDNCTHVNGCKCHVNVND